MTAPRMCSCLSIGAQSNFLGLPTAGDFRFDGHVYHISTKKKVLPFTSPLVHALIFEKDIKYKDDFMMIL